MNEETPVPFKDYFPKLSMSSYFWLIIVLSAGFFGIVGYFIGVRVNELSSVMSLQTQQTQIPPIPTLARDNDTSYSRIYGFFTLNTNYYQQLVISVDSFQNGVRTGLDTDYRYITKPRAGVSYPYSFDRLDPAKSYIVSASACTTDPKTYALNCAKHIAIIKCSGAIQGNDCVVKAAGNQSRYPNQVDFSLTQSK